MGRRKRGTAVNGWLAIDKPLGLTSTQVVGRVRRLTDACKVGHGGTLDPLATGILPIALGEATKAIPYVMDATKVYDFTVRWGEATDTDDAEGSVTETAAYRPDAASIEAVLGDFTGAITQVPPAYSAIKVDGQRAYDLARDGQTVVLAARQVTVERITLLGLPDADHGAFRVVCGKGTYVRALARDMARALGTAGHLSALRRTRVGPFNEGTMISLEKLEELVHSAPAQKAVLPVETALDDIPALAVTEAEALRLRQGQAVHVPHRREGVIRIMADDVLIAIGDLKGGRIRPLRVFNL
ncbi:MAG: tRNA pseudouridine(55) synthase TruB [Sphingomonadales bacterium]